MSERKSKLWSLLLKTGQHIHSVRVRNEQKYRKKKPSGKGRKELREIAEGGKGWPREADLHAEGAWWQGSNMPLALQVVGLSRPSQYM